MKMSRLAAIISEPPFTPSLCPSDGGRFPRTNSRVESMHSPLPRPSGTLSRSEGERDGVRGFMEGVAVRAREGSRGDESRRVANSINSFKSETVCTPGYENGERLRTIVVRFGSGLPRDSKVFRPITTMWPVVICLNHLKSSGKCHGIL